MYEHHSKPLLPIRAYIRRQVAHVAAAMALVVGSLAFGMLGYHLFEGLDFVDSMVNAAMILGGMGPVSTLHTASGKVFASCYALYSGIVFLVAAGIIFAPLLHRSLHRFHIEQDTDE